MVTRMFLLLVMLLAVSANATGQVEDGVATQPDPQSAPLPADPPSRAEFNELVAVVNQIAKNAKAEKEFTAKQLAELRTAVDSVTDLQVEDRELLDQLSQRDENGRSYLRIDASHEPTRLELQRAIDATIPDDGMVIVDNKMNSAQLIAINGTTYEVLGNTDRRIPVPLGPFKVQLRNQSETRFFPPKKYEATVTIQPQWVAPIVTHWISAGPTYYSYVSQ